LTPVEFQRHGIRMYGRKHWRREYSVNLGLDPSTVWRISTRPGEIPNVVEVAVKGLLEKHKQMTAAAKAMAEQRAREKHRYKGKLTFKKAKKKPRYDRITLIPYAGKEDTDGALEETDAAGADRDDAV
jgi:hypothetical protein